ncbi:MAG: hypothetical protein KAH32_06425 [Chlamydiia bacterium]|nr:hypothetical protein [Chlamydiia bacterium]
MKKFLLAIATVSILFTGCNKDDDKVEEKDQPQEITITDYNGFSGLTVIREVAGDLVFDVKYEYNADILVNFNSVKLYYTLNSDFTDAQWTEAIDLDDAGTTPNLLDDHRVTIEIEDPTDDSMYSFTIAAADVKVGDVVRLYFRGYAKDIDGNKSKDYYAPSATADTFDHDLYSTWTEFTVK